jgi:hypothetical protein
MRTMIRQARGTVRLVTALVCSACGPAAPTQLSQPSEPAPGDAAPEYAEARCAAMFECPCSGHRAFDTQQACAAAIEERFDAVTQMLEDHAGFQQDCFDSALAWWSVPSACGDPADAGVELPQSCELYVGDQNEGEPCVGTYTGSFFASNCGPGLRCDGETCGRVPPALVPVSKVGDGETCVRDQQCDGYCDDDARVCAPEVATGSPCARSTMCTATDYCLVGEAGEGACVVRPTFGEPCPSSDFRSCYGIGTACIDGVCATPDSVACAQGYLESWW